MTDVTSFMELFIGNGRSFGRYFPENGRMLTLSAAYDVGHVEAHLSGEVGLGMVPILDTGGCRFAAIDIDAHGENEEPIDCESLSAQIADMELPLVVCRSKSNGAHLYCFFSEEVPAAQARSVLARWAIKLGYPGVEVFPKQSQLIKDNKGNRALGNWINLPYFGGKRVAVEGGRDIGLDYFFELARSKRLSAAEFEKQMAGDEYGEAPPCFQRLLAQGVPKGEGIRNNSLFLAATYFKKAFPDNWKDRAFDFNNTALDQPLPFSEAKKTIDSISRKDYSYRCQEEPCASLCDRKTCLTRKHGISPGDASIVNLPDMGELRKYDTTPIKWQITVGGRPIFLTTAELMSYSAVRAAIVETLHFVPPMIKNTEWDRHLTELMKTVEVIEVPDEASTPGLVRSRLHEWLKRVDPESMDSEDNRKMVLRGVPVVTTDRSGDKRIVFRAQDFVDYLKRTRSEELKGVNLWLALKGMGVAPTRLRVDSNTVINAWYLPLEAVQDIKHGRLDVETEL